MLGTVGAVGLGCMLGCGGPVSSTYYNPAWTYDGKILAVRQSTQGNSTLFSGGGDPGTTALVIMNADGSGEREIMGFGVGQFCQASASPSGNYVALVWGAVVDIYTYPRFDFVRRINPPSSNNDGLYEFDWAPGDQKMVLRDNGGAYVYGVDGRRLQTLTGIWTVGFWRYTANIYASYDSDGTVKKTRPIIEITADNQIVRTSPLHTFFTTAPFPGGEFYYSEFKKFRLSDFSLVEEYPTLSATVSKGNPYNVSYGLVPNPINPVNPTQVIYSGPVVSAFGGHYQGITVINLDGTNERELRR